MSDSVSQNGWNEYSRLVLKELETLSDGIDSLNSEIQGVKEELAAIRAKEDKVEELKVWKEKIDEIVSPTQLNELKTQVEDLKTFKTKAVTIFAVVQFGMAAWVWIMKVVN
tara:strand:- start:252 stop:584 length:333 start_codon:yes stop_codon:yes gene_type:complete